MRSLRGQLQVHQQHVHADQPGPNDLHARQDCAAGLVCTNGTCQSSPNPTGCTQNEECGSGGLCVNGQCETSCGSVDGGNQHLRQPATSAWAATASRRPPAAPSARSTATARQPTCINGFCHGGCVTSADCSASDILRRRRVRRRHRPHPAVPRQQRVHPRLRVRQRPVPLALLRHQRLPDVRRRRRDLRAGYCQ